VQTGGSVQITKKLSIGAELVTGKGYVGYNINVGLINVGLPFEEHSIVEYARVFGINPLDIAKSFLSYLFGNRKADPACP